jgi:ATP-dependent protease ClpP protease subunit
MLSPSYYATRNATKNAMKKAYVHTKHITTKKNTTNSKLVIPFLQPPNSKNGTDDDEDDEDIQSPLFPKLFGNAGCQDVYTHRNHIFFKTDITPNSIDKLATEIDNINNKMESLIKKDNMGTFIPKPIYLHITTNGGDLLAGFFGYDKIKNSKIPINTIIEGGVASAGSLLSIAGKTRYITANSHLLIHQLRTGIIGTYEQLVDERNNCNQFMSKLVDTYRQNCNGKMSKTRIKEVLKRDIFWNADTTIENGFADEIWQGL